MTQLIERRGRGGSTSAWADIPNAYGPHETYQAVSDACYVYRYRDLEHNLRRFGWRQARKRILRHGTLSGEWVNRGRGELRLRRKGLEVRFEHGKRTLGWRELQEFIQARRS